MGQDLGGRVAGVDQRLDRGTPPLCHLPNITVPCPMAPGLHLAQAAGLLFTDPSTATPIKRESEDSTDSLLPLGSRAGEAGGQGWLGWQAFGKVGIETGSTLVLSSCWRLAGSRKSLRGYLPASRSQSLGSLSRPGCCRPWEGSWTALCLSLCFYK